MAEKKKPTQDLSVLGAAELQKELHLALDKRAKLVMLKDRKAGARNSAREVSRIDHLRQDVDEREETDDLLVWWNM